MQDPARTSPEAIEAVRLAVLEAYRANAEELSRLAIAMTRNKVLAQDVLQETFLRYFLTRMHGEKIADESAWLRGVMRDLILDWKKVSHAEDMVALEDVEARMGPPQDGTESGHRELAWVMKVARILAPREQQCINLRSEGLAYSEIATAMQISVGTVGALLNRAVQKLKRAAPAREGAK
jgi:RNA polymerase sigma factor (sigma-70 family)